MERDEVRESIRERLRYDPDTGEVTWRVACGPNAEGALAGTPVHGRLRIGVLGNYYPATHIIWVLMTGEWPTYVIDHINGDPMDDRWCNLQDIPKSDDSFKKRKQSNNRSGVTGIHQKKNGSWTVQIRKKGQKTVNKTVKTFEEAMRIKYGT